MLRVAYISTERVELPKKLTEKELIHNAAVATLEERKHIDREKAKSMFPEEWEEIRRLEKRLAEIRASKLRKT